MSHKTIPENFRLTSNWPSRLLSMRTLIAPLVLSLMLAFVTATSQADTAVPISVNVNQADAQTIAQVLDGIGISRAQAIVAYRTSNGAFKDIYDLTNVKGVGEKTIELNEQRIQLQ